MLRASEIGSGSVIRVCAEMMRGESERKEGSEDEGQRGRYGGSAEVLASTSGPGGARKQYNGEHK
jgi:hypothetical protein